MKLIYIFQLLVMTLIVCTASAVLPKINLGGKADYVLPASNRDTVLEVADYYLGEDATDTEFLLVITDLQTPFAFEQEKVHIVEVAKVEAAPVVTKQVVYDDKTVLEAVASKFAKKVQGTMGRNSVNYLQVQGSGLMKVGSTFPANLPSQPEKIYTITISGIDDSGYTLKLGDASLRLSYDGSTGNPRAVKFYEE